MPTDFLLNLFIAVGCMWGGWLSHSVIAQGKLIVALTERILRVERTQAPRCDDCGMLEDDCECE